MSAVAPQDHDRERLAHCERLIETGVGAYFNMGLALREIQEHKLYRHEHSTFEEYLNARWGLKPSTAYRCIGAAITTRALIDGGETEPPRKESQVRPLVGLDESDAREAWSAARDIAGGKRPTARQVAEAVSRVEESKRDPTRSYALSSQSVDWGTPTEVVAATRELFGGQITMDPASSKAFNERIGAVDWVGLPDNGLDIGWHGRVLCNPPYGTNEHRESNTGIWLNKAIDEVLSGRADAVLFWAPSHIGKIWLSPVWEHLVCIFNERQLHVRPDGTTGDRPTHGNLAVLVALNPRDWFQPFRRAFDKFGPIAPCIGNYDRMKG